MKLNEFQKSDGIPRHEMICLLGNPNFTNAFYPVLDWQVSKPRKIWNALTKTKEQRKKERRQIRLNVPGGNSILFFGHPEKHLRSMAIKEGLSALFQELPNEHRFIIVCGKCDYELEESLLSSMPDHVCKLFINNLNISDPRLGYLPIGRDYRSIECFSQPPSELKEHLLYCNFSLGTHPIREEIYDAVKDKQWIKFEHMGEFLKYEISRSEFYQRLGKSKFVACPRGHAIDTFRMWDALYLGAIPIVVKEAAYHEELRDLPILFIDKASDFAQLTPEFLEQRYNEMLDKSFDYRKLYLSHWIKKILNAADFV